MSIFKKTAALAAVAFVLLPQLALACACGCGVFDVSTNTMYPNDSGGTVSLEYDYMNQNHNWSGSSRAPAADNDDKDLRSQFYTAGVQYMFNRTWGFNAYVPFVSRSFLTDDGGGLARYNHSDLGDIRIGGIYTGLSGDMSSGLTFGLKLPTGDHSHTGFDRDTDIGSGSTDVLLGAYKRGYFAKDVPYSWFVRGALDQPVLTEDSYRPGTELHAAVGGAHEPVLVADSFKVAPVLQVINSYKWRDGGANAAPGDTGYERVLISPGLEFSLGRTRLYTDVSIPVYQHVNGNQLVAPVLFKAVISHDF